MILQTDALAVEVRNGGVAHLVFDFKNSSVNKFSYKVLSDLKKATNVILDHSTSIKAVVVSSAKPTFIVGADITEFLDLFALPENEIRKWLKEANAAFNAFEDLPMPTVAAVNGLALGGGLEMCLACDFRVMSLQAQIGFPEVKLGLFPGFGGTVRFARLVGPDTAMEWICQGKSYNAMTALKVSAVDAVVEAVQLKDAACDLAGKLSSGVLDWSARRRVKTSPVALSQIEQMMSFTTAMGQVKSKVSGHYPAAIEAIKAIQAHVNLDRDPAIEREIKHFVKMTQTKTAVNLVNIFLNDQVIKKLVKHYKKKALTVANVGVIGSGVMGSGISQTALLSGFTVTQQDISSQALRSAYDSTTDVLNRLSTKKVITQEKVTASINAYQQVQSIDHMHCDFVIEAAPENKTLKHQVLKQAEKNINDQGILCSNTSTISIDDLSAVLKRPERFCGLHFFNPVSKMPLVEVIRGKKTSEDTLATVVVFASKLKKTPIVVNDCPGFFVNRVLFPYLAAFLHLVHEGVSFQHIDQVMKSFGWPMGPAHLIDVIGIDVACAVGAVMAKAYPDRMQFSFKTAIDQLRIASRLGQKNQKGFYDYKQDKNGRWQSVPAVDLPVLTESSDLKLADEVIVERLMLPLCLEVIRCFEENIVNSAAEADMALILGLGFPPYLGGALRYVDEMGHQNFMKALDRYKKLSSLYAYDEKIANRLFGGQIFR